jgi:hypothetical protein
MAVEQRIRVASANAVRQKKIVNLHNVRLVGDAARISARLKDLRGALFSYADSRYSRLVPHRQVRKDRARTDAVTI